jgi:hypothetical protein
MQHTIHTIHFTLNYHDAFLFKQTAMAVLDIPTNTSTVTGSCGNDTQVIKISWIPSGLPENQSDSLLFVFSLNTTTKIYHLTTVNISLYPDLINFPGAASK